ncbi:MAG: 23S rRNA (adenine(2503)-C(2))-methyltransferase RlmN [Bacteroides sp.]|nr:23S rRNA (adenine(2503)-C(2))-methyltransferase RlmN [Bacteroides sp.]MCM1096235.1 23S rRNA (adenine(2503)-C(2))-methyltransferase RlmN [Terasakiella sp.]
MPRNLPPLIGMNLDELRQVAAEVGLKPFAAKQMAAWLYARRATSIDAMTDLSKAARERLARSYRIGREEPLAEARSADGTAKYLFSGAPGRDIETVMIPDRERATLCVSSQAGCKMRCAFCMTGRQGFHGSLSAAQIINQVLSVPESAELTNIVFMGMGEPADNLDAVLRAIDILTAPWGLAWSPRRITVSTVGISEASVRRLLDSTDVHLALSIHSPFAAERASLMPAERALPSERLIGIMRGEDFAHQRRLSVEYIMWGGLNDSMRHADALARLLRGTDARVNIIPFHHIPDSDLRPSPRPVMEAFRDRLNSAGIIATIRASRGQDIDAACGLLAGRNNHDTPQSPTDTICQTR